MLMLIGLLFLVPAYYCLKARGYRPAVFLWPAVLASILFYGAWVFFGKKASWTPQDASTFRFVLLLPGFTAFVLSWMLPARKGALEMSRLSMEFVCPQCEKTIRCRREREGLADVCPLCGEIVTVPLRGQPDQPPPASTPLPTSEEGPEDDDSESMVAGSPDAVVLCTFVLEAQAESARIALLSEDIPCAIVSDTGGGILPMTGVNTGYRVLVLSSDRDRAEACLKE
jgi:hypothetical protein